MTAVAFDRERWYADRGRRPLSVERLDALGPIELVRVEFEDGDPALYSVVEGEPEWGELFERAGGAFVAEGDPPRGRAVRLDVDQSHSSWRVGDAMVKCYRRLVPGIHPEVELGRALSADLPEHAAAYRGSIEWRPEGHPPVALAIVQEFVDGAEDGWEWTAGRAVRGEAGFAESIGAVARRVHDSLARAFPTRSSTAADRASWRRTAEAQLDQAVGLAGELGDVAARISHELARLGDGPSVELTRLHGDLHVGQYLHTPGRIVIVDFEGLPARAPEERRALDTPLRDLASLARSIDHCGHYAVERHGGRPRLVGRWSEEARQGLFAGYGAHDEVLRRALEFDRAVYEFVYASRYLPEWLYAPRAGLAALLES